MYPILIHYRTKPYLNRLPKYLFTRHSVTTVSAAVLIIRRRNKYPCGRGCKKKNFRSSLTVPKIVAQCQKHPVPYLSTCITYLNALTRLSDPYLNKCITYLNTLSRLSAPYLNTCITYLSTLSRLSVQYLNTLLTRQPIRIENPRLSAANQNRVLGHSSRQPIRIEHYITRVGVTSPESSLLWWRYLLGSRLESARYSLS